MGSFPPKLTQWLLRRLLWVLMIHCFDFYSVYGNNVFFYICVYMRVYALVNVNNIIFPYCIFGISSNCRSI